jgi:hypothetical protein
MLNATGEEKEGKGKKVIGKEEKGINSRRKKGKGIGGRRREREKAENKRAGKGEEIR